jgi:TonB family protein
MNNPGPEVHFKILSNGSIKDLKLADSSGLAMVNSSALSAVESTTPFDKLKEGSSPAIDVELVFDYRWIGRRFVLPRAETAASSKVILLNSCNSISK